MAPSRSATVSPSARSGNPFQDFGEPGGLESAASGGAESKVVPQGLSQGQAAKPWQPPASAFSIFNSKLSLLSPGWCSVPFANGSSSCGCFPLVASGKDQGLVRMDSLLLTCISTVHQTAQTSFTLLDLRLTTSDAALVALLDSIFMNSNDAFVALPHRKKFFAGGSMEAFDSLGPPSFGPPPGGDSKPAAMRLQQPGGQPPLPGGPPPGSADPFASSEFVQPFPFQQQQQPPAQFPQPDEFGSFDPFSPAPSQGAPGFGAAAPQPGSSFSAASAAAGAPPVRPGPFPTPSRQAPVRPATLLLSEEQHVFRDA